MSQEEIRQKGIYYTIIDGTFRTKVEKDHPQAVMREYETSDGAKAIKYERHVDALVGYIEEMGIYESDFGKVINIKLDPNSDGRHPILQLNIATTFGEDFLRKIPGVDLSKPVRFRPYAFTDDKGKEVRGMELTQEEVKFRNFFWDYDTNTAINGYPVPEGVVEEYGKEDWKIHFLRVRKFLMAYFTDEIVPKLKYRTPALDAAKSYRDKLPDEEINPEDIPF